MQVSLIVAASENGVIGRDNDMPWRLPTDLKRFKTLTMGRAIIMGRNTYVSIGKPLPGRLNIIVTRDKSLKVDGGVVVHDLAAAFEAAKDYSDEKDLDEYFVIGGAEIYHQSLPYAGKVFLTRVHGEIEGDTFFPELEGEGWKISNKVGPIQTERDSHAVSFLTYMRD